MEVKNEDLLAALPFQESKIGKANSDQVEYKDCCDLLFKYYKDTHETINPLTSTLDAFIKDLPNEVFYAGVNGGIQHAAFVKDNEIAYVSSNDKSTFNSFALTVANQIFATSKLIFFEADNVDWAAMAVKNLLIQTQPKALIPGYISSNYI